MGKSSALNTNNQYIKYTIEIIQNSQSIPNNTSNVTVKVRFYRTNTGYETYGTGTVYCKINGTQYSASVSPSQKITNSGIELFAKTLNISHGTDGSKTLTCSAWISHERVTSSEQSYSQVLTKIPRNVKIINFTVSKRDETSVKFYYTVDATCDYAKYSINDGGTWFDLPLDNIVKGLNANQTYKFKVQLRRKDSQLWTVSSTYAQTTYDYPHCTSTPNFKLGDAVTLTFYNPLNRAFKFYIIGNNVEIPVEYSCSSTTYKGLNSTVTTVPLLYQTIPNAQSGKYVVRVVYGNSIRRTGGVNTYSIKGTEIPTINAITYKDTNDKTFALTQNRQQIVQGQSLLKVEYEPATPNNSAGSITKYTFELNGVIKTTTPPTNFVDFGAVNSATDVDLTVTATDSRGLSAKKVIKISMIEHHLPEVAVTLARVNNYEDETHLTVDASISSINGKNSVVIKYRYKEESGEFGSLITIPKNEKQTLICDKNKRYVFQVYAYDSLDTSGGKILTLDKGLFPLFIDTEKNSVGINAFPEEGEALRVAEGVARFNDGIVLMGGTIPYVLTVTENGAITITKWSKGE